jgi:hypothetical protein
MAPSYAVTTEEIRELLFKKGVITEAEFKVLSESSAPQPSAPEAILAICA